MNRNYLKVIALVSMLVDHIGLYFFNNFWALRLIGRLAFPIFAFFIAEGYRHTKSRKKYVLTLLSFALFSQISYMFLRNLWNLNILFTFLLAILCIYLVENYQKHSILYMLCLIFIGFALLITEIFGVIDYGFFGVLFVVLSHLFYPNKKWFYFLASLCLMALGLSTYILSNFALFGLVQFFAIASLGLIALYNGQKGKLNLKWLFYIFYPLHLAIILIILVI